MNIIKQFIAALVLVCATAVTSATAADAATPAAPTNVALHDASVQQSFAYDATNHVYVFAQSSYPGAAGDITLTKTTATGAVLGYMHLKGFGHGLSIGLEPASTATYVWTEAVGVQEPALGGSADAGVYGTKIARETWINGATLTPTSRGVALFAGNQPEESPSIDMAHGLIGVHYWSSGTFRYVVYRLADFKARHYVAIAHGVDPPYTATSQGWALNGTTIARIEGDAYVASWNPPPGNTVLMTMSTSGVVLGQHLVTVDASMTYREPEGVGMVSGVVCAGFASGAAGTRHYGNVVCEA